MNKELLCFIPIIGYGFALKYFAIPKETKPFKMFACVIYHAIILVTICIKAGLITT